MILHYLKIAWRNLRRYKTQTIISIVGLTIGVVFFTYGYHWYTYETTYDSFYPNSDRIYRVYGVHKNANKQYDQGFVPYIAVEKLRNAFPEIEEVAIQFPNLGSSFKYNDKNLGYPKLMFVDENFFRMFPPKVILGELDNNRLKENEIIITESFARKHFDNPGNAIGKTLISGYDESYIIKAVIENPPGNTLFQCEGYVLDTSTSVFSKMADEAAQWRDFMDAKPFFLLHANTDIQKFREKLRTFAIDNDYNDDLLFEIVPLSQVSRVIVDPFNKESFDIRYIRAFTLAGILLLFAAFFNYLNILINTTFTRVRQMNLRRVTGASAIDIFWQLFVEMTLLIAVVAFLSLSAIEATTRLFESVFSTVIISGKVYTTLLVTVGIVAFLLYLIAYLFLYRFIQKTSYKKQFSSKIKFSYGRFSLVLQLVVSLFFITSAFLFYRQVSFMEQANWGFNKDNLLQIKMNVGDRKGLMRAVSQLPMVESIIETDYFTILQNNDQMGAVGMTGVEWEGRPEGYNPTFQIIGVGENFIRNFELTIIEGRDFTEGDFVSRNGSQTDKIIINETAISALGIAHPIGKKIIIPANWFSKDGRGKEEFEVIGIVKDFHTIGLQNSIPPLFIKGVRLKSQGAVNYVRVTEGMEQEGIDAIRRIIPKFRPDNENDILVKTMNSLLDELSKTEQDLLRLFLTVSLLSILVAVFGIYSVSQRETQRRRKEIAIRKTAGAQTKEIIVLFLREYLGITFFACALALPIAGIFMHRWLQNFAYRISITWWMFLLVVVVVSLVVLLTIISQVTRAASQNPAEAVKTE